MLMLNIYLVSIYTSFIVLEKITILQMSSSPIQINITMFLFINLREKNIDIFVKISNDYIVTQENSICICLSLVKVT